MLLRPNVAPNVRLHYDSSLFVMFTLAYSSSTPRPSYDNRRRS